MNVALTLLVAVSLQHDHHQHEDGLAVTGDGPAVLVARTASRAGPFGHVALLNERLEPVALAEVDRVTGWAVRREGAPLVAVLEAAGRGAALLRVLDGETLEPAAAPLLLEGVARPRGPLRTRGVACFSGDRLLVLGDPLQAPGEGGAPTLWAHSVGLGRVGPDEPLRREEPLVGFPASSSGPFSLAGARDDLVVFVSADDVTCVDAGDGEGETFALPAAGGTLDEVFLASSGPPRLTVRRGATVDALDPRLGEWTRTEEGPAARDEAVARRVDPTSARLVTWDRRTGAIDLVGGPRPPAALPESLKDLQWLAPPKRFPASWVGRWSGPLEIASPGAARPRTIDMILDVAPTDDPSRWRFAITYDDGRAPRVRDYTLVEADAAGGRWVVDEGNGVEIESWFVVDTLTQAYAVGLTQLVIRWRRDGDVIAFELTAAEGEGRGFDTGGVVSYGVQAIQRAELRR